VVFLLQIDGEQRFLSNGHWPSLFTPVEELTRLFLEEAVHPMDIYGE
jgi:hypothetical protein